MINCLKFKINVFFYVLLVFVNLSQAVDWPCWRGPRGDGTSLEKDVPTKWDAATNIIWKTAVPGAGHASPIVWSDRIFTVTAISEKEERILLCLEGKTGEILWQQTVLRAPLEGKQPENSYASSTPATDGKKVYVSFLDVNSVVVASYDFTGKQLWLVRFGTFKSPHGFCSSPVLYKDKVILNTANKAESCVVALSREDGRTLWKIPQQNSTLSYSTPLIREMAGRAQMIVCANKSVTSYNPDDGSLLWVVDGPSEEFVASPVYSEEARLVFISSSFPQRHLLAIRPDGSQNVTQSHILWRTTDGAPYVPSPIVEGDYLLTVNNRSDEAFCYEAATGKILWQEKLGKSHSSPVSANGLIYFLNDDGVMNIVKAGPKFDLVAQNKIGEKTYASPAISQNKIFIRGDKHLFCIGKFVAAQGRPTLFLIGDSTVKTGKGIGENGQWGWGSFLAGYFDATRITIDNRALGGRSSRTYQTEGLWDQVLAEIKPGDFVIMQFGHNDGGPLDDNKRARGTIQGTGDETREIDNPITGKKEIVHTYGWYMRKYITDTKAKSATPIVCSLIPRNIWVDGQVVRASDDYGKWAAKVANDEGALFIDLNEIIAKHYEEIGQEKVSTTFFGPTDHTHTTAAGAQLNASSVVEGLRVLKDCLLKHYLLDKPISSFQKVKNREIRNP